MALTGTHTFVGFGFGPIQAGLFLYEAFASGNFRRLVVAEVLPDLIAQVRGAGGTFSCNIAHADRVEQVQVGPVEIEDPAMEPDRTRLVRAVAAAQEIATAIPSINFYATPGPGSLHRVLAEGLRRKTAQGGPRAVVYAAENHNQAAEMLKSAVLAEIPAHERDTIAAQVCFLNTVIAKMSGLVHDPAQIQAQGLAPVTRGSQRAFLVEAFRRILISQIRFDDGVPFRRGIEVFEEKMNLLPFEEAKFFGHNATHALAAYIGAVLGVQRIADLRRIPGALPFVQAACIEESGAMLVRKYAGLDPLFTPEGYRAYADDLLQRMFNPYLQDSVERVGRDPQRKLGWDDRLIGTMRFALQQGITPRRYAFGAAAALALLHPAILEGEGDPAPLLEPIWQEAAPAEEEKQTVLDLVRDGCHRLRQWQRAGFVHLEQIGLAHSSEGYPVSGLQSSRP
jgi:mannitol-1-phosphate/altronate dehydrogenase